MSSQTEGVAANAAKLVASDGTGGSTGLLQTFLDSNPYFQAGFGLMGVGLGFTLLRRGVTLGSISLQRRLLVSMEIPYRDHAYGWVLGFMAQEAKAAESSRSLMSSWLRSNQLSVETNTEMRKNGSATAVSHLVAGPGTHYLRYKGAWIQVIRQRETRAMAQMSGQPWETITLTTLSRDRAVFSSLLQDAKQMALRGNEGKLVINTAWGTDWRPFGLPRRRRPLQSVVLEPGMSEKIEQDAKAFLGRRQWYADRGIPYRRGYLLHGPPGSGKTSYIQALAGSLGYDICLLNLSERGLADDKLIHLLSNIPERCFVLIEDVDAAFNKRVQTSADGYQSSVTFSGFLNALDGVASGEERVMFMTTNHLERLDPALIRPGRVDMLELIDDASPVQARTLFEQFYAGDPSLSEMQLQALAQSLEVLVRQQMDDGKRISMASLQGLFIRTGVEAVLEECPEFFVKRT